MRNYSDKTLEAYRYWIGRRNSDSGIQRMRMASVLTDMQLALQILNLLLTCGSEDVNGTTENAGMTHNQFSGNPRACDNGFRSDQPCQSLLASTDGVGPIKLHVATRISLHALLSSVTDSIEAIDASRLLIAAANVRPVLRSDLRTDI
jgi:hypothetical protein